jgi:PilZ domain
LEEKMNHPAYFEERRRYPRYSISLPFEYWQTDGACRGGIVGNLSEGSLLIYSLQDMPVGEELNIRIFYPNGYEFDGIRVTGKIVWEGPHYETDWKGYRYGIEFIRISAEDSEKLANLLRSPSTLEEISTREEPLLRDPPPRKPLSSPSANLDLCQMKGSGRNFLWKRLMMVLHLS